MRLNRKGAGRLAWLPIALAILTTRISAEEPVSYYDQVRPILQANCQGCHQPAKAGGDYVMTTFDRLLSGGESESPAVVPGKPDESYLLDLIKPTDGVAEMPQEKEPLTDDQIALIRRWIEEGARDDTPENARQRYDQDHPPVYTRLPVVTALDYSPDGQWLAVAAFHEVLLHHADGSGITARLVGVSERIESVAFSPDGRHLAVTGGLPGRMGEVQVWNVEGKPELILSLSVTYDTIYGGRWSPDGKLISFGAGDNTVRAISVESGQQVLFQGAHEDWVRDTIFSRDGSHLVSVSRDMTVKLTEVATERFVDNVTSITPGALKGGINSVARHPERDEVVIGGSDGVPRVYRLFRETARKIGDDANLIRKLPGLKGRIFSLAVSRDGKRIAACSSLDGAGQVGVYGYEFDTKIPEDVKKIESKTVQQRSATEKQRLEQWHTADVKQLAIADLDTAVYAAVFHPDGQTLAVSGGDGQVRLLDTASGSVRQKFAAAPLTPVEMAEVHAQPQRAVTLTGDTSESLPEGAEVVSLRVLPNSIQLTGRYDYVQLLATAQLASGDLVDVTRIVERESNSPILTMTPGGVIQGVGNGRAQLQLRLQDQSVTIPVAVSGFEKVVHPDFVLDVNPVISRLGCNQGTCHGAAAGKNGFKLSLRGYDAIFDIRAFTDDLAARRLNVASPDDSLMLLKATGAVPHVGGQLMQPGQDYYETLRGWIADGAPLNLQTNQVTSIEVFPKNPTVQWIDGKQQIRVLATYSNGRVRDVTREAFITSGNTEVAEIDELGLMTAVRRGEAPVLARFEGSYAATTLTVMGNREGFAWQGPPIHNRIDGLVASKWQRMKIQPSKICSDAEFVRRVYLDLTGLPPTAEDVRKFLDDQRDSRAKREALVDDLIGSPAFVDHWTNKWADLLQVNRKFLGAEGAVAFRQWIHDQVAANRPYDEFVRDIVTSSGSNRENPAASYYKILRTPEDTMENTTHLFLGVRFNCNKCHDHPFERWTQDQYYETAAYFAQFELKTDPESKKRKIGGTAVEGAKPLFEIVTDKQQGDVIHARTQAVAPPTFPFDCDYESKPDSTRREKLAAWLTSGDNQYFARSYVNRLWGYMFGIGIIEPIDDIRAGNPPSNPELLEYLTQQFLEHDFDVRHVMRLICKSRTYQLSVETNRWNEDDSINYSHALARRLPAEVLYDAILMVTGSKSNFPGVAPGTRAAALPDTGVKLPSGFLTTLGRPPRESACECERSNDIQLGPVMALVSGPVLGDAIADPGNALTKLVRETADDRELIQQLFLRILNRTATDSEVEGVLELMDSIRADHMELSKQLEKREQWWAETKPGLEAKREQAIAKAQAELEAFTKQIQPDVEKREAQRKQQILTAEKALKEYNDKIAQHVAAWEKNTATAVEWHLLSASALQASNGATLRSAEDRSIRADGKKEKGIYTVTVKTSLDAISAFRLEALPVEGIEGHGPGLPGNGNFVVTEFEVFAAPADKPKELKKVELHKGQADFTQTGFNIAQTLDGNGQDQKGWAIHPAGGIVHWATFETKKPIQFEPGVILQFRIHQVHNAPDHRLARFRLSCASGAQPVGLSLPESLNAVVSTPRQSRSQAQKDLLLGYFRKVDAGLKEREANVATAKQPLPEDAGVTERKARVAAAGQPVADDPLLVRLRTDAKISGEQLKNIRLTAAQDLAWALINSPAFLFNH